MTLVVTIRKNKRIHTVLYTRLSYCASHIVFLHLHRPECGGDTCVSFVSNKQGRYSFSEGRKMTSSRTFYGRRCLELYREFGVERQNNVHR